MTTLLRLPPSMRHAVVTPILTLHRHSSRGFSSALRVLSTTTGRSYADAIALLDTLQSNRTIVASVSDATRDMNLDAIPEMLEWTRKAGYDVNDFAKQGLKCVHVAGTKGKGSVCVMVENILLQYRRNSRMDDRNKVLGKIGLYTSPHLVTVRERIRIDGAPISESTFTRYFFELWDRFSAASPDSTDPDRLSVDRPGYFRYLTLLALHAFLKEGVETAIVECGIGGEYDSTNILPKEAVTVSAITRLGIDHVGMLGDTIEKIARHKAGIMKEGTPTYTVPQATEAQVVLRDCAVDRGVELKVVERLPLLDEGKIKLSLEGEFQKDNASLAIAVAASHLRSLSVSEVSLSDKVDGELPLEFAKGLETARWPGRCEVRKDGNIEWLIDGAHTVDSLEATAHWYISKFEAAFRGERPPTATMLIFNQQDRDAQHLIRAFMTVLATKNPKTVSKTLTFEQLDRMDAHAAKKQFTYGVFCTNTPFKSDVPDGLDLGLQEKVANAYQSVASNSLNVCYGSVEEAVDLARKVSQGDEKVLVLVTGSLHLVGALLQVLERDAANLT